MNSVHGSEVERPALDDSYASPPDMGLPVEAWRALILRTQEWRRYRQPVMGTRGQLRKHEAAEREALFRLGTAALFWLWHAESQGLANVGGEAVHAGPRQGNGMNHEPSQ